MRIIAVDDEQACLEALKESIAQVCPDAEVHAFRDPQDALDFAERTPAQVAMLDVRMRGMSGLMLAKRMKELNHEINIIFVTGFDDYKGDAMDLKASGYILKPVTAGAVEAELSNLRRPVQPRQDALLRVQCFGNFDVFTPDGEPVRFERSKAKEILAYLIYKRGSSCTVKELAAVLFEDRAYTRQTRGYVQRLISSLAATLRETGAGGGAPEGL